MSLQSILLEIIGTLTVLFGLREVFRERILQSEDRPIDEVFHAFKQREE